MDGYVFKNIDNTEYGVLAPNLWNLYFKMFELQEIMRQRESKVFAEILNRLREGKQTPQDILIFKERVIEENSVYLDVPHLFIENCQVNAFNDRVHNSARGNKFTVQAQDSVIGANSEELRNKILKQIPVNDPRKTKQLLTNLCIAEGERTEIAINVRTDDGITNGAGNIIKKIHLQLSNRPSGIIWVQFDHADVGQKTRAENKHLYIQQTVEPTWTPIKPVTTQFAVGRNRTAQVVRKQFPLRPAAAKTIHRSQGDTEKNIVVNFSSRRAIPHIHYVGLSRVTTIEGLYITNLSEDKIAVSHEVQCEMQRLRSEGHLKLCITPIYHKNCLAFKLTVCFLNTRSLHRHIKDIRTDLNYSQFDISIFSETRISHSDTNSMYAIDGYNLFRHDSQASQNIWPYGSGIEITVLRVASLPDVTIVAIYRSPKVQVRQLCISLMETLGQLCTPFNIFIGDFNINWLNDTERTPLYNLFVRDHNYRQLVLPFTTDYRTTIDHIFTNLPESQVSMDILETYFSDHKCIYALIR